MSEQEVRKIVEIVRQINLLVIKYLEAGGDAEYMSSQLKQLAEILDNSE